MYVIAEPHVNPTDKAHSRRHYLRRRAVNRIRNACEKLPTLGDVSCALKFDPIVRDAVLALVAMGLSIPTVVKFVSNPVFTEAVGYVVLARATAAQMVNLCFGALTLTIDG